MKTNDVIKDCLNKLTPKKVLDLGIGKGRCSKRFIEKGSEILGVDLENKGLRKEIKFIKSNIKNFCFKGQYDLIIASLVLHFFRVETSKEIIEKMKNSTESNGYNFILTMNSKDNCFIGKENNFYLDKEELKKLYCGWEIIQFGDFETDLEEHGNLKPHNHNLSFILAKKPNLSRNKFNF